MRHLFVIPFFVLFSSMALARDISPGDPVRLENGVPDYHQYEGKIIRVIDADTITVRIFLLPGLEFTIDVRARGVDAPELRRPKCDWEKKIAEEAKKAIEKRFPIGSWVYIENIEEGSFSGRVIADIKQWYGNQRWRTVTKVLLAREGRWGVPYQKGKTFDWCRTLSSE